MNILIVDDNPTNLKLLRAQLEAEGHLISAARDGVEALAILNREHIDAVISDILMPRMDGYRLCYEVRKQKGFEDLPFIIYTATYTSPSDEQLAHDVGTDKYLRKPAAVEVIVAALREVSGLPPRRHRASGMRRPEAELMKEYSERLVNKLEERNTELSAALERLRTSEEGFRQLAETIQEVFWVTDPSRSRMLYVSPAYEKIWGRSCKSLYDQPRTWLDAIHPEDRERVRHAAATRQAEGTYDEEYRIVRADGEIRWIRDQAFPVRNTAGEAERVVGVARDITDKRRLEAQFVKAQKMEALGTLAGGIAHDFNNILGTIIGNAELAQQDVCAGHPAIASLTEIRKACQRARDLVERILAFGRQQQQPQRVIALRPVVEEAVALLRRTLPAGIELVTGCDNDTPTVRADPTQIHQVLMNLCTNAWHAMGGGIGRIDIRLGGVTLDADAASADANLRPGRFARLSVTDNGSGIDAATLGRIFEPFFTTKPVGQGTGMGLSVVHGIVETHGGAVTVTSHPGIGTTFFLYFPAAKAPQPSAAPKEVATERLPAAGGQHVLYLDDDESLVFLVVRMLERLGYRVSGSTQAQEVLAAARADPQQFDLVITDLNMPGISGLEVARELARLRSDLPVVLTSGYITEELREAASRAGVRQLVYKPNTVEELCAVVRHLAGAPKMRQEESRGTAKEREVRRELDRARTA